MYILILISVFLVNSQFMMLTALLPLFIFDITQTTAHVGTVLMTFMASLLIVRIYCLKKQIPPKTLLLIGSANFFTGFLILFFFTKTLCFYYAGGIFFGSSVGIIGPALLTVLTGKSKHINVDIGIYNTLVAIASAVSPILGEVIYKHRVNEVLYLWVISSAVLFIIAIIIFILTKNVKTDRKDTAPVKAKNNFLNRCDRAPFIILFWSSISYGAVISYLPIHFNSLNQSVGVFYFFFWLSYIGAQFYEQTILVRMTEKRIIISCLIGLIIGMTLVAFSYRLYISVTAACIYGFCYGILYHIFYYRMSQIPDEYVRNNGYAVIGLMSYIGVGITPILVMPVLKNTQSVFIISACYTTIALAYFCRKKKSKVPNENQM